MTNTPPPLPRPEQIPPDRARRAMKETLRLVRKMGSGALGLLANLKRDKSPTAMLETLESSLRDNKARREAASGRIEMLHDQIVQGKKALATSSPARRRILESELRSKLAEYKGAERELNVLLENERVISQVKGRINEIVAYDIAGVSETLIDDIIDEVDERAEAADAVASASRDLEHAGRRRARDSDEDDLAAALAEFDDTTSSPTLAQDLAGFDEEFPEEPPTPESRKGKEKENA